MINSQNRKPRVGRIVALLVFGGILAWIAVLQAPALVQRSWAEFPPLLQVMYIGLLIGGFLYLLCAILIANYKRSGLFIALFVMGLGTVLDIITLGVNFPEVSFSRIIRIALGSIVVYYLYIYLTREPEKNYFT